MSFRFKMILLSAGLLFALLHFGLLLLQHTLPVSKTSRFYYASRAYENFFHQSWNVFVPPPDSNYKLYVQFEKNGVQKKDLFEEIKLKHQSNRLGGYEPLLLLLSNCITGFEKSTALQAAINGPVKQDINFAMIEQAAKGYVANTYRAPLQKLILVVEPVDSKRSRIYFN